MVFYFLLHPLAAEFDCPPVHINRKTPITSQWFVIYSKHGLTGLLEEIQGESMQQ